MLSKGQRINERYEILKSIGEGGMANVYLAHDAILDRDVAIKVLRGDLENDEKFIRRFQREAKSVSDLTHPNIVEVYDVGEEDGQHYIVMEYIDGKTLKQLIQKRGALTVTEVIDIMSQLTDGLSAAHDSYIIHRDIKPQNIMILDNGMIKITDFGIAMSMNATQLTQTNSVMGSVHYLPPEQASGKGATMKSDIYSAGILMYELLTGSVPFKGDNAVEIALKQMKERIPSIRKQNPLIPQSVENIVLKATAKNPKNRYDSIRDMHNDIIHAMDPEMESVTRYNYPYPESEMDESKAIPIKDVPVSPVKGSGIEVPENYDVEEDNFDNKRDKKDKKQLIFISIGGVVLLLMIVALVFFNSRNNTKVIEIPDVTDMTTNKAESILKKKGFKFEVIQEEDDKIEEGHVIRTKPKAGSSKRRGSIITIVESSGTANIILKDYTGQDADSIYDRLGGLGIDVRIEKKKVDNASDYVGKSRNVIDQNPKFSDGDEVKLKEGDKIVLYVPDILSEYPDMVSKSYTLAEAEEFASSYGLKLSVKDKKGNSISDYSSYLDRNVIDQSRTGKIASGASFTVTIDVDMSNYNLVINYKDKDSGEALKNTETQKKKDGETGNYSCPGISGYSNYEDYVSYKIDGRDAVINCFYIKRNSDTENNE